jgi:hypothetical protein
MFELENLTCPTIEAGVVAAATFGSKLVSYNNYDI